MLYNDKQFALGAYLSVQMTFFDSVRKWVFDVYSCIYTDFIIPPWVAKYFAKNLTWEIEFIRVEAFVSNDLYRYIVNFWEYF